MDLLTCRVMPYPWGSRTAIPALAGRTPGGEPEAELWMGAHPALPSTVDRGDGPESLEDVVSRAPDVELGAAVVRELGPRLPFLLKVLAAAQPLSLQAHPSAEQARVGFDDEERRGIPRTAAERNYKDPSAKPELLCALTPFDALAGFRPASETLRLFDALAVPELEAALLPLRASSDAAGLETTFHALMTMPEAARLRAVDATVRRARARAIEATSAEFARDCALVTRLAALYPGDIGVVSALLLAPLHLEPGQAIYLGAGNLHAYLEGTAVEIMASSDNVLRGGLTKKHVDVPELLRVLDFSAAAPKVLDPRPADATESVYDTPAPEFRLSVMRLARDELMREPTGPEILLVTEGVVTVRTVRSESDRAEIAVPQGGAVFVPAATARYAVRAPEGRAVVFRASTNLGVLEDAREVT